MKKNLIVLDCALLLALCSSCHKIPPDDGSCVVSIVEDRIESRVNWDVKNNNRDEIDQKIDALLQNELDVNAAVQIALLNHPDIQAAFEDIGIARAGLLQASLFQNPVFSGFVRYPNQSGLCFDTELDLIQNLIDILARPLKMRVAKAELNKSHMVAANTILSHTFRVKDAYYHLVAAKKKMQHMELFAEAAEAAGTLALSQKNRGNINDLEMQEKKADFLDAKVKLAKTRIEIIQMEEDFNSLLGFSQKCWRLKETIPKISEREIDFNFLETRALECRPDLAAACWEIERLAALCQSKPWWIYTEAGAGVSSERNTDGSRVTGPLFSLALPFVNFGQAEREQIGAMYRQAIERYKAMRTDAETQLRKAEKKLIIQRELALFFQNEIVPLREKITSDAQKLSNIMGLSVYRLLTLKQQELMAKIDAVTSLHDYWLFRVELERAAGLFFNLENAVENDL